MSELLTAPVEVQPVFDPRYPGKSLDHVQANFPVENLIARGSVIGEIQATTKGFGFDLCGAREYEDGDLARDIDWAATASDPEHELYTREYYEEITPPLIVVTDMFQRRHGLEFPGYFSERNLAMSAILSLTQLAAGYGMPTAVIGVNDTEIVMPYEAPKSGARHQLVTANRMALAIRGAEELEGPKLFGPSKNKAPMFLADALRYAAEVCGRGIVAVVSDFRSSAPDNAQHSWATPLAALAGNNNELLAVETTNIWDFVLPAGASRIAYERAHYTNRDTRYKYQQAALAQQAAITLSLSELGVKHYNLSTDNPRWLDSFESQLAA